MRFRDATYCGLYGGFQVLLDALAVEDMLALRLDGIFCDIIAESADRRFTVLVGQERSGVCLAAQN